MKSLTSNKQAEALDATEYAWLVERGQSEGQRPTVWLTEDGPTYGGWTTDANRARRFDSREAAEKFIASEIPARNARATEHGWLSNP